MRLTVYIAAGVVSAMMLSSCGGGGGAKPASTSNDSTAAVYTDMTMLSNEVDQLNASMPVEIEGGLKMTHVSLDSGMVTYTCQYPASMEFKVNDDASTKSAVVASLPEATTSMLRRAGLGLRYIYVKEGVDSAAQVLEIPASEI